MSFNRTPSPLSEFYISTVLGKNHASLSFLFLSLFPFVESVDDTTSSPRPSLTALLLLVPLVAAAVGVLLWRQRHISDRGESCGVFFFDSFPCSVHLWPLLASTE